MVADEEDLQIAGLGAEQQADFQPGPALEDILLQPPDGDPGVKVRPAKTVGQDSQRLLRAGHIRVAQVLERGEKSRTEQDGRFSHAAAFQGTV